MKDLDRRRYLATIAGSASTLLLAGCSDDEGDAGSGDTGGNGANSGSGSGGNSQSDVEILEHSFYEEQFSAGVRGIARNTTDRELSYVEANAVFLDSDGTQIGDGLDNVSELAAGRDWEFDCMFLGEEPGRIDSYEIEVSSGF